MYRARFSNQRIYMLFFSEQQWPKNWTKCTACRLCVLLLYTKEPDRLSNVHCPCKSFAVPSVIQLHLLAAWRLQGGLWWAQWPPASACCQISSLRMNNHLKGKGNQHSTYMPVTGSHSSFPWTNLQFRLVRSHAVPTQTLQFSCSSNTSVT